MDIDADTRYLTEQLGREPTEEEMENYLEQVGLCFFKGCMTLYGARETAVKLLLG